MIIGSMVAGVSFVFVWLLIPAPTYCSVQGKSTTSQCTITRRFCFRHLGLHVITIVPEERQAARGHAADHILMSRLDHRNDKNVPVTSL